MARRTSARRRCRTAPGHSRRKTFFPAPIILPPRRQIWRETRPSFALQQVTVTGSPPPVNNHYALVQFDFPGTGVTDTRPKGINDSGEIVGYYLDGRPDDIGADGLTYYEHGFYSTLSNNVWQYSTIDNPDAPIDSQIGELPSPDRSRAFAVNNNGEIVGWYSQDEIGTADNGAPYVLPDTGFIDSANWPGTYGKLGFSALGDFGTHALGINSSDQIVGYYVDGSGEEHGFLRNFTGYGVRGAYIALDPPNSVNTVVEGINDSGQITGFYQTADLVYHGFLYNSGTGAYTPIDFNGGTGTQALGINNSGEIVGNYFDSSGAKHGFVRSGGGNFTTIDDPNAGSGGTLVGGINNNGEIVGWYTGVDGHDHGFIALPIMPPILTVTLAHDTGSSATDGITSNDALTGTVQAAEGLPANPVVTLTEKSTVLGTAGIDGTGNWSFTPSGLADGQHTIVATAVDATGNSGSASVTLTLDVDAGEQAALSLTVNAGTPIGSPVASAVPFAAGGLESDDNGSVTFADGIHAPVVVNIVNGVPVARRQMSPDSMTGRSRRRFNSTVTRPAIPSPMSSRTQLLTGRRRRSFTMARSTCGSVPA
jgi:probable HAF family extracellular repeat protein